MSVQAGRRPLLNRIFARPVSSRRSGLAALIILALPALIAIWGLSWLVVQDGPLYIYNTHVMLESFRSGSPFADYYTVNWYPLPYWGAYVVLMALMQILSERAADQVLITLTSVGIVAAIAWLRWRVAGWNGMGLVAPLAVVLSINILWLFGLYSFLLGVALYLITLGIWWTARDRLGPKQAATLAALLIAGYFCHLVSIGLTVIGLGILALFTPGQGWRRRVLWTGASIAPLIPAIIMYRQLMQSAGEVRAEWSLLENPLSLSAWITYIRIPDLLLIHYPEAAVTEGSLRATLFHLPEPSLWAVIGIALLLMAPLLARRDGDWSFVKTHRGWIALAVALLVAGFLGPDKFGGAHGGFLRERILLVGFATLIPILRVNRKQALAWVGWGFVLFAAVVQMALLWDYALTSNRLVGAFMEAKPHVGTNRRVAALMANPGGQYRASPITHIPNMLGVGTGNLIWNNYGPALYYFPVRFRNEDDGPRALDIGNELQYFDFDNPATAQYALEDWEAMLETDHEYIDVLVVWHSTPEIDLINSMWFDPEPVFANEHVKVLIHRQ